LRGIVVARHCGGGHCGGVALWWRGIVVARQTSVRGAADLLYSRHPQRCSASSAPRLRHTWIPAKLPSFSRYSYVTSPDLRLLW